MLKPSAIYKNRYRAVSVALLVTSSFGLSACGDEKAVEGSATEVAATAIEKATDEALDKAGADDLFDPENKTFSKRACEFLTPEMVSGSFGVPAAELKKTKIMGCIYSWKGGGQTLEAQLMLLMVHKNLERAKLWFENSTASKTNEELNAEMDAVKEQLKEHETVDTELKKKTAGSLTELAKMGTPDEGVRYEDVPGIGDGARVSSADGTMTVRMDNLTFRLAAFKGPEKPKIQIDPKNLKGMAKKAMEIQKKWIKDTVETRKEDVKRIAPLVVKAIAAERR